MTREEGVPRLFRGASSATSRAVLMTIGQLSFYDQIKAGLLSSGYFKDNLVCHFASSLTAVSGLANYASPTSGKAYRDRRLTTNFELWVEIFCVPTCFHVRIPKPCLSVCPHPEKRYHHSFVNISPTLVIDTSIERSSRVLHHGNPEMWNFFKKFEIAEIEFPYAEKKKSSCFRQYQSYISNWYVNGKVFTSTTTWEPKNLIFFFKKVLNWIQLVFWLVLKSWNHSSRSQHAPICRHRGCIVVPLRVDI